MSFVLYRNTLLAGVIAVIAATGASAQGRHADHPGHAACGMAAMASYDRDALLENTRAANPTLFDRITGKRAAAGALAASDLELTFLVRNRVTNQLEEINGVLVYDGIFARVWVDVRDTTKASLKPTSTQMRTLFRALDTAVVQTNVTPRDRNQGILKNDIDVFGDIPRTYNVENKTDFLLLDIKDAVAGQNVLGYFSPTDQLAKTTAGESNEMNLLYIDSKEGFQQMQTLLAIIAHEFQHLIHYGRHPRTGGDDIARDVALNEGMSEVASILNGYHFRSNSSYLANTNISMFDWHYSEANAQEADYQRAMTFAHYLSEHYGERFLYELVGSTLDNMPRLSDALRRYGLPESYDFREVLKGFAVANYLQTSSNPSFGYDYKLKGGAARPHSTSTGTGFPATGSAVIQPYGTYYIQYSNPGPMRFRFSGSSEIKAMLIGIRSLDTAVVELQPDTDYTLPLWEGGAYDRVVVALINTAGGVREASWTASALTSGVAGEAGAAGTMRIDAAHVDANATATIDYTVGSSAPVRLDLFDVRGERVLTIVDGQSRAAGSHREVVALDDLASGSYVARLVQNGAVVSTMILVSR